MPIRLPYTRLGHYVYRHFISIIVVSAVFSVSLGFFATKLRIKADSADLLPQDYDSVRELNRIKKRVGGIGPLMIVITGEDLDRCVDFLHVLADSLEENPLVSSVIRGKNHDLMSRNRLLFMELSDIEEIYSRVDEHIDLQKLKRSPLYFALDEEEATSLDFSDLEEKYDRHEGDGLEREYYLTKEKNGVILRLYPTGVITDQKFTGKLFKALDRTIAVIDPRRFHPTIEYSYQGSFKNARHQYEVVVDDLKSTALLAFLGVIVLISVHFRQLVSPVVIAIPLLMSLSWTFGLTYLVIGNLNQITVCLFAILFGLGIDFGIHIFARYRESRRRDMTIEDSLVETIVRTGSALTTTALTTSVAFFSLLFSDFKGFSEFGFIVGTGILLSLMAMLFTCPAFIVLAERLHLLRLRQQSVPQHLVRKGKYPLPLLTIAVASIATVYSLYHVVNFEDGRIVPGLGFEYDFKKLRPDKPAAVTKASIPDKLKESRSPAIVLTESRAQAMEVIRAVKLIKEANGDSSTISSVKSVYSALPSRQREKLTVIERLRSLIDDSRDLLDKKDVARVDSLRQYLDVSELTLEDLPAEMTKSFSSKEGEILSFVMINAAGPLRDGRYAIRFADEVREIQTASGDTYYASSANIIFADMLVLMLDDAVMAVVLTLLVVTVVLLIDLRRVVDTILVLTPLLTAMIWVTGIMYIFDFKVNIYNIVAFPTIIGMGIDNAVHVLHRYREAGPGSLRLVLRTTGVALVATTLTTMVGFAGLVPADHPALYWIGTVTLIGLGCCFISSVTLMPALLQLRERFSGQQALSPGSSSNRLKTK